MEREELINKIKDALDIKHSTNLEDSELYYLLERERNKFHPDKTTEESNKQKYTEKFQYLTSLLKELGTHLSTVPVKTSQELTHYERNYQLIEYKNSNLLLEEKIDKLKNRIEELNKEISNYKLEIESLKLENAKLQDIRSKEEAKQLIEIYKPTRANVYAVGLSGLLLLAFNILSQLEKSSSLVFKYIPFLPLKSFNSMMLYVFGVFILLIIRKYLQEDRVDKWTKDITTSHLLNKLFRFGEARTERFTESEVTYYIIQEVIYSKSKYPLFNFARNIGSIKRIYLKSILGLDIGFVAENLKNICIHNLLSKGVIKVVGNRQLEKVLEIKNDF